MLIRSITVEDFLPFQGKQRVDFSTDKDRNVTLVMGNNGAGKTSLAQAFEWCLYGKAPKDVTRVINAYVLERVAPGSSHYASVEIELEKDGKVYFVTRKQEYSRKASGNLDKPGQHEFVIRYKEDGEFKQVAAPDQRAMINRLLSSQLSHYFFFDGEHVKNMRAEIERGKSNDFADAVKTILGLQPIASALSHLKASGNKNCVQKWFKSQYDVKGNANLEEKKRKLDSLAKKIDTYTEEKELAEDDRDIAKERKAEYEQLLRDNAESEQAQRQVENARRHYSNAVRAEAEARARVFKVFKNEQYRFLIDRPVKDALVELSDEDKISKGIPSVDDKTIKYLLDRGECLCGTKFENGDDIAKHLYELLEYVPPKDLGTYISEFDKMCHVRTEAETTLSADLAEAYKKFEEAKIATRTAKQALEAAQAFIESLNNVDVGNLRRNLKKAEDDYQKACGRVEQRRSFISAANSEMREIDAEIKAYSAKNAKNQEVSLCLDYVDYIYDFLSRYYEINEAKTRECLIETVNKFFTKMYDGEIHLELDNNYGVTVTVDQISATDEDWSTSSGQTLAIILSFILGILDIAKDQSSKEDELCKGDTYPLVMDAPLSDFDKERIETICKLLPEVAEQVIIIIKDTDGDLAEEHMRNKIGRRYSIERRHDFDSIIKE